MPSLFYRERSASLTHGDRPSSTGKGIVNRILLSWSSGKDSARALHVLKGLTDCAASPWASCIVSRQHFPNVQRAARKRKHKDRSASEHLEIGRHRRAADDGLRDGRAIHSELPDFAQSFLIGICAHERLGLYAAIAGIAGIVKAGPFENIVEIAFEGDLEVVNLHPAFRGIQNEANRHAGTDGREKLFMGARGEVRGVERFG